MESIQKEPMADYDPKWAEVERRLMALEERLTDFSLKSATHEAVCGERQKTIFNMIAALDAQMNTNTLAISNRLESISKWVETLNSRFIGWHTGITSALFLLCVGLVSFLWTNHK